jgi:hypothetical protein
MANDLREANPGDSRYMYAGQPYRATSTRDCQCMGTGFEHQPPTTPHLLVQGYGSELRLIDLMRAVRRVVGRGLIWSCSSAVRNHEGSFLYIPHRHIASDLLRVTFARSQSTAMTETVVAQVTG